VRNEFMPHLADHGPGEMTSSTKPEVHNLLCTSGFVDDVISPATLQEKKWATLSWQQKGQSLNGGGELASMSTHWICTKPLRNVWSGLIPPRLSHQIYSFIS